LTNHSQLFFLHSTVISQFLTLTISSTGYSRYGTQGIVHRYANSVHASHWLPQF